MNEIRVSALVLLHPVEPALHMVRKQGTTSFMLPGGKPEPGEGAEETIIREIAEELGLDLEPSRLSPLGTFAADAANEVDHRVIGDVFSYEGLPADLDVERIQIAAEIAEAGWFPYAPMPSDTAERQFAPLTRDQVVPAMIENGLLSRHCGGMTVRE